MTSLVHSSYDHYGWFDDKVCKCINDNGIYHNGYPWENMAEFKYPPTCRFCGLWADRVMRCNVCKQMYYQFFSHPSMGYHHKEGWYCYSCLEMYNPPVVESAAAKRGKIPPPNIVLPPDYEIYIPEDPFASVTKRNV